MLRLLWKRSWKYNSTFEFISLVVFFKNKNELILFKNAENESDVFMSL